MNDPLVSILMPTVNQRDWLFRALDSIKDTATDFSQIEILLRIDDNDPFRIALISQLKDRYGAKAVVGPAHGYTSMHLFVRELLEIATGRWAFLMDDDAWIEGDTWQQQLQLIEFDTSGGPVVQAELYQLGPSLYPRGCGACGLIVPTSFAKEATNHSPVDQAWHDLITQRKYITKHLANVTYCHDGRPR
jgi:hypothetical protein